MARYKHIDTSPRLPTVNLQRQLLSGTIEYALNHLFDHKIDLSEYRCLKLTRWFSAHNVKLRGCRAFAAVPLERRVRRFHCCKDKRQDMTP